MTLTVTSDSPVAPVRKKVDVFWTAPVDKKGVFRLLMVDWGAFLLGTILARVPWVPTLPTIPSCWTSLRCTRIGGVDKGSLGDVQRLNLWTAVVGSFATVCKQGDVLRVLKKIPTSSIFHPSMPTLFHTFLILETFVMQWSWPKCWSNSISALVTSNNAKGTSDSRVECCCKSNWLNKDRMPQHSTPSAAAKQF